MAHRQLLTDEERQALLGIPVDADSMARCFTLSRADRHLVAARRRDANRIGFAVQLALLRHPGIALAQLEQPVEPLVQWLAKQLEIPAAPFTGYAHRPQTMTDHARLLALTLGLRSPANTDLPMMIEAAAQAAWSTDRGQPIAAAVISALRTAGIILPAGSVIERTAIAGRARARRRATDALLAPVSNEQIAKLDRLLVPDASVNMTPFAWLKAMPVAPKADHIRELLDRLRRVRDVGLPSEITMRIHEERLRQLVREGYASDAHQLGRYAARRRRAILVATTIDLEARLTDAVLDMADKLIGGLFAKARNTTRRRYAASAGDVGRLMRMFHGTIEALAVAQANERDAFEAVDEAVGWAKLLRVRSEVEDLAKLANEDPLLRAADRWRTLRRFAPDLIEALEFCAVRAGDPMLAALQLLAELNRSGQREVPADAPMPFRKEWRRLVTEHGAPNRRLYEMAVLATLRDKLRSGDIWVERSSSYRRFDSYLLPSSAIPAAAAELGLPATADEWLMTKAAELDRRLKRFARRLQRDELEGVEFRDGRLQISPVKATITPEARAFADVIEAMMPRVRITELLHEVNRATGFAAAFTNLRTGERCDEENALLAAILADATNLGLGRMAAASHGVTRDKLVWTADAYIRPETYKAALARIIDAHHALPIATIWGDGRTSSSDRQFFRSAKRGDAAGEINARYGHDPGLGFYTHVSDQHGPYSARVMSATSHEAPYVLDGLMHHGTALRIGTHYTDTGGASDHVFILCALLGFRFCPRLRDFPDRKFACIDPAAIYKDLQPLFGRRIRTDVIREHWDEVLRLVASLQAGTVMPSAMLKRLAAFQRQNQLDLALQELGRIERTLFIYVTWNLFGPDVTFRGDDMTNTAQPGERWPALAAEPAALAWLGIRSDLGLAPRTLDAYSRGLSEYLVFCAAVSTDPLTAGRDHVARYVRELTQRPPRRARADTASSSLAGPRLANATVQQRLTAVRLFYDHLIEEGVRDNNPVGRGRYAPGARMGGNRRGLVPHQVRLPWIPDEADWRAILDAARREPIRNRMMLALAYDAGLRREELCSLRTDDIDPGHRLLRIRAETTKGRRERVVPYSAVSGELLRAYLGHRAGISRARGPLFLSESRRNHAAPLTPWTWSKVVRRIALAAGVPRFGTHTLRHLCLTDLAHAGWELHAIATFAGHRNPATTLQYIHLSGRELASKLARGMAQLHDWRVAMLAAAEPAGHA